MGLVRAIKSCWYNQEPYSPYLYLVSEVFKEQKYLIIQSHEACKHSGAKFLYTGLYFSFKYREEVQTS